MAFPWVAKMGMPLIFLETHSFGRKSVQNAGPQISIPGPSALGSMTCPSPLQTPGTPPGAPPRGRPQHHGSRRRAGPSPGLGSLCRGTGSMLCGDVLARGMHCEASGVSVNPFLRRSCFLCRLLRAPSPSHNTPPPASFPGPSQPRRCPGNQSKSLNILLFPQHSGTLCGDGGPCDCRHR